jgi:hypothetical protein
MDLPRAANVTATAAELRFMRFASRSRGASNPDCHLDFRCTGLHVSLFSIERN